MTHVRATVAALFAAVAIQSMVPAQADEVLGVYVGGAIGQSEVQVDSVSFNGHDAGWKALIGVRAVDVFGGEAEYVDLGRPHGTIAAGNVQATATGPAVFGVAYLPLPLPYLDLYAKAGLANIQEKATVTLGSGVGTCAQGVSCAGFSRSESQFAWGAGSQIKSGSMAVRAEFEQFRLSGGNVSFATIGFYWTFL